MAAERSHRKRSRPDRFPPPPEAHLPQRPVSSNPYSTETSRETASEKAAPSKTRTAAHIPWLFLPFPDRSRTLRPGTGKTRSARTIPLLAGTFGSVKFLYTVHRRRAVCSIQNTKKQTPRKGTCHSCALNIPCNRTACAGAVSPEKRGSTAEAPRLRKY